MSTDRQSGADKTGADATDVREQVRQRYAAAARHASDGLLAEAREGDASCCSAPVTTTDAAGREVFGATLYGSAAAEGATDSAIGASLGCGVPTAVADLHPGETVLDLGSGAAPMCSSPPAGSAPAAARSGWT